MPEKSKRYTLVECGPWLDKCTICNLTSDIAIMFRTDTDKNLIVSYCRVHFGDAIEVINETYTHMAMGDGPEGEKV